MKKFLAAMLILSMLTLNACQGNGEERDVKVPDAKPEAEEVLTEEEKLVENSEEQSEEESTETTEEKPAEEEKMQEKGNTPEKPVETKQTEPQDVSIKTETSAIKEEAEPFWKEGLSEEKLIFPSEGCMGKYSYFYLYNDTKKLAYRVEQIFSDSTEKANANLLIHHAENAEDIGKRILNDCFFEIVNLNDDKYQIEFYEDGVLIKESKRGNGFGEQATVKIEKETYKEILSRINTEIQQREWGYVQWLAAMKRSRITDITFTSIDGTQSKTYGGFDNYVYEDSNDQVTNCRQTDKRSLENAASVVINFNNNLQFKVWVNEENLLIYASDIDSALLYDLKFTSTSNIYDHYAKGQPNPRTGKPVIYLYPEKETDCRVTVDYPRFSYTYPTYEDGWNVTAFPDGRLINKKDNSEHYYLFWEGNERIDWSYEEGFVVKGEDTETFLREKLAFMGLTPREYNDFITYWVPQMKNNPYNLITFAGEQYEKLAPLTVTPQPDSVLRVHMVYKPLKEKMEIKEQILKPFERKGFTVVEWGGTRDD